MRFDILTIFPEVFPAYFDASILGRAKTANLIETHTWNIRDYATDKHKTVDDTPYGGGAGMVMKVKPIDLALQAVRESIGRKKKKEKRKIVVMSARGEQFTQAKAAEYAKLDQLILICGRYEGIDQRVADHLADEEISIGPYVLAGGEVAAMAVIEATARLIPGVLGNEASLAEESFSTPLSPAGDHPPLLKGRKIRDDQFSPPLEGGGGRPASRRGDRVVEYPQYTKPEDYNGWKVLEVLLSGNHAEIKKWRESQIRG